MKWNSLIFYLTLIQVIFKDYREIDLDFNIEIPIEIYSKNDIILKTKSNELIYLKIQEDNNLTKFNLILNYCKELIEKYSCNLNLYVLFKPNIEFSNFKKIKISKMNIKYASCNHINGDVMIEKLNKKLRNDEPLTNFELIGLILLPFLGSYDEYAYQLTIHKFLLDFQKNIKLNNIINKTYTRNKIKRRIQNELLDKTKYRLC